MKCRPSFFELVLGARLKYSCGWWVDPATSLDESEEAMLRLTCERAGVQSGMRILDLGCGWGSLSLWIAERYPNCRITSLSNSSSQRASIEQRCEQKGLGNVEVITADVGTFNTSEQFDRVISVEMFEHVRNHEDLLSRIAKWLVSRWADSSFTFFCHRNLAYTFETDGEKNWMGRHFFSGGIMPAKDLFLRYQRDMTITEHWWIEGRHYARTCEAWLSRLDGQTSDVKQALASIPYGDHASVLVQRWRMFFHGMR